MGSSPIFNIPKTNKLFSPRKEVTETQKERLVSHLPAQYFFPAFFAFYSWRSRPVANGVSGMCGGTSSCATWMHLGLQLLVMVPSSQHFALIFAHGQRVPAMFWSLSCLVSMERVHHWERDVLEKIKPFQRWTCQFQEVLLASWGWRWGHLVVDLIARERVGPEIDCWDTRLALTEEYVVSTPSARMQLWNMKVEIWRFPTQNTINAGGDELHSGWGVDAFCKGFSILMSSSQRFW